MIGGALCLIVPSATIGKSSWNEFRAKVGNNKVFLEALVTNHFNNKSIETMVWEPSRKDAKKALDEGGSQMGKLISIESPDTIPSMMDAISKGWELSYNVPVQFEKGYRTFTIRVRNDGLDQKVISITSTKGILARDNVKSRLRDQLP